MDLLMVLSSLILITCFILIANKRVKSYIRTFRLQSILIAASALYLGIANIKKGEGIDVLIVCLIVTLLKVIFIPMHLNKTFAGVKYKVEKDFFLNIPMLILMSCCVVAFVFFSLNAIEGVNKGPLNYYLVNSVSIIFLGLFFMISRKKAIGQIVGFFVIENGLFVTAMFSTNGMPIIVDLGIFIDLITAVLILGVMVFKIDKHFETTDINNLKNLKG